MWSPFGDSKYILAFRNVSVYGWYTHGQNPGQRAWLCLSPQEAELGAERFCALSLLGSAVLGDSWG